MFKMFQMMFLHWSSQFECQSYLMIVIPSSSLCFGVIVNCYRNSLMKRDFIRQKKLFECFFFITSHFCSFVLLRFLNHFYWIIFLISIDWIWFLGEENKNQVRMNDWNCTQYIIFLWIHVIFVSKYKAKEKFQ